MAGVRCWPELVCGQASRTWRRQLGALAWVVLEELELTARRDGHGWASPARIHPIAAGIGTTDAAAVRAIAAVGRAGLLILQPVANQQGTATVATGSTFRPASSCRTVRVTATALPRVSLAAGPISRKLLGRGHRFVVRATQTMAAVRFANCAGALACMKVGALAAIPTRAEVDAKLNET